MIVIDLIVDIKKKWLSPIFFVNGWKSVSNRSLFCSPFFLFYIINFGENINVRCSMQSLENHSKQTIFEPFYTIRHAIKRLCASKLFNVCTDIETFLEIDHLNQRYAHNNFRKQLQIYYTKRVNSFFSFQKNNNNNNSSLLKTVLCDKKVFTQKRSLGMIRSRATDFDELKFSHKCELMPFG